MIKWLVAPVLMFNTLIPAVVAYHALAADPGDPEGVGIVAIYFTIAMAVVTWNWVKK